MKNRTIKSVTALILAIAMLFALCACGYRNAKLDYLVLVNKENRLPEGDVAPPPEK